LGANFDLFFSEIFASPCILCPGSNQPVKDSLPIFISEWPATIAPRVNRVPLIK
jgi:hypothetical protein